MAIDDPQSEREWIMVLSEKMDALSKSIDHFGATLKSIEDTKLFAIEQRLSNLERWQQQANGSWKAIVVISAILAAVVGWVLKSFSTK